MSTTSSKNTSTASSTVNITNPNDEIERTSALPTINEEKLIALNDYETIKSASKFCFIHPLGHGRKKSHSLQPEQLKTGFGLHSLSSLELAIKKARSPKHICLCDPCHIDEEEAYDEEFIKLEGKDSSFMALLAEDRLRYLMGLPSGAEEISPKASQMLVAEAQEEEVNLINGGSEAMRKAQRYLREHKIFEFFQFLIAHLLGATPYDPITFLINLLDKCLIYRSGICDPPLLYDKKHIECLFNLMDRMRSGFIDYDQYKTGMYTLGIKSYNQKPPMTDDEQVTKLFFVEEGYECLKDLLNDMIRKRSHEVKKSKFHKVPRAPPPSVVKSLCPSISDVNLFV